MGGRTPTVVEQDDCYREGRRGCSARIPSVSADDERVHFRRPSDALKTKTIKRRIVVMVKHQGRWFGIYARHHHVGYVPGYVPGCVLGYVL